MEESEKRGKSRVASSRPRPESDFLSAFAGLSDLAAFVTLGLRAGFGGVSPSLSVATVFLARGFFAAGGLGESGAPAFALEMAARESSEGAESLMKMRKGTLAGKF
jgi:hypothetical protein